MLVVVRVDPGVDLGTPAVRIFAWVHGVGVQDTGELDLELDGAVLVEDPIDTVFVVGCSEDVRDDKLAGTSHSRCLVTEIHVLEQDASVLFVDANGILDRLRFASFVDKGEVHVMDRAFAVAAQGEAVGHVATTILSEVKSMLPVVRMFRVAVWDNHLRERYPPENRSLGALVVIRYVRENDAFAVIEANMDFPILPADRVTVNCEADSFGLCDVNRLEVLSETAFLLNGYRVIIIWRSFAEWSTDRWHVNVDDFVCIRIEDGGEVKWICILAVIRVRPIVHEGLLQANVATEALVVSNCPCYPPLSVGSKLFEWQTYDRNRLCAYPLAECQLCRIVR